MSTRTKNLSNTQIATLSPYSRPLPCISPYYFQKKSPKKINSLTEPASKRLIQNLPSFWSLLLNVQEVPCMQKTSPWRRQSVPRKTQPPISRSFGLAELWGLQACFLSPSSLLFLLQFLLGWSIYQYSLAAHWELNNATDNGSKKDECHMVCSLNCSPEVKSRIVFHFLI